MIRAIEKDDVSNGCIVEFIETADNWKHSTTTRLVYQKSESEVMEEHILRFFRTGAIGPESLASRELGHEHGSRIAKSMKAAQG